MKLFFNDGTFLIVETVSATGGALTVRMLRTDAEELKKKFGDPFATEKMTADGEVFEGYTILDRITEYNAGIWEVVNVQKEATTDARLSALEEKTAEQTSINEGQDECIVELYELLNV